MAEKDDSLFGGIFSEPIEEIKPDTTGALDYLVDIPVGAVKGVSQAVKGLLQLGAMPVDYLADTNLITAIDNVFDKITPETETVVGDITSILGQFALPAGAAIKIANGVVKLSKASQIVKLNSLPTLGAKGAELAKRAGYYGSIGGITDFAVSTPGDLATLSETVGFGEAYKGDELEGSLKAEEFFKEKIRFGAEGALLGGGLTAALPVAGTLGFKYGLKPAGKALAYVGGKTMRAIDYTVFNPISLLAKKEGVGRGARNTMEFFGNQSTKLRKKLNIPDPKEWKFYSPEPTAPFKERFFLKLDKFKNQFTSSGPLSVGAADDLAKFQNAVQAEEKSIVKIMNGIDKDFKNIAEGAEIVKLPKYLRTNKLRYPEKITAIDDQMYLRNNDLLYDYIQAPRTSTRTGGKPIYKDSEEALSILNKLPKKTQIEAKQLKERINDLGIRYSKILMENPDKAIADFGSSIMNSGGAYLKQVFSVMKNKAYAFDVQKITGAKDFFKKNTVPKIMNEQPEIIEGLMKDKSITRNEAIDLFSDRTMAQLQKSLIESNRNPESLFRLIASTFKIDKRGELLDISKNIVKDGKEVQVLTSEGSFIRAGGSVPDLMKKVIKDESFEAVNRAFLEPIKDYRAAVTDTFLQTAKNVYQREFFDKFTDSALKNGYAFRSREVARAANIPTNNLQQIKSTYDSGADSLDLLQSKIFNSGIDERGMASGIYTTPEIANAIKGTEEYLTKMYDIPLYSALMSVKAAGQIGKTVFSPMTQVRNVSTASFFALASGLIGGRVSLTDSFKLMADDIFPGKFVRASDVAKQMENRIARGVVDQNIEVNEIKTILEKAKKGKFTLSALMENPTVKKAFDLYQGGDNVWKVYADDFYQDALGTALSHASKSQITRNVSGDQVIRENIIDWYKVVGKQDDVVSDLTKANDDIAKIDIDLKKATNANKQSLLNQKENLVQQFKDVKDISAYLVTNTIPTYSKVPAIIKNIRNLPLGNFVAFPAEILRTSAHLLTIGARELTSTNPFIRQMGARRLVGSAAVFGGTGKIIESAAKKITGVDSEKMEAFQRSIGPDYQKNSNLIPLTQADKKGNFKYFNFSYTNPYDSMLRPINAILNAYGNGKLTNQSVDQIVYNALFYDNLNNAPGALTEFFSPFISESIGASAIADLTLRNGRTKQGKTIFYENDTFFEKLDSSFGHLIGQLEPGGSRSARRVWKGVTQDFTDYGTTYDSATELVALMSGLRVEEAKPLDSLPFVVTSYAKDLSNIQKKFSSNIYRPNLDLNARIGYMSEYLKDNYDTQSRMSLVLKDMENMGVDIDEIEDKIGVRLKNKTRVNALMNNEFVAPSISQSRVQSIIDKLYEENPEQAIKIENSFEAAADLFDDLRYDLEAIELGQSPSIITDTIESILNPEPRTNAAPSINLGSFQTQPKAELPSQITGTPVAPNIIQSSQTLGNIYGINKNTGLTASENALLSDEYKAMRLKQRNLA